MGDWEAADEEQPAVVHIAFSHSCVQKARVMPDSISLVLMESVADHEMLVMEPAAKLVSFEA